MVNVIEIEHLIKNYDTGAGAACILRDVSLNVQAGEFVAVVGPSGSGKSTLINMLTGIDRPTSGRVTVAGTCLNNLNENQMARWRGRNIGVIFQFFQLLPTLTILENVMLPMDFCSAYPVGERQKRALGLLDQVGLADQAHKLPGAVSGGQQQRAAIARALANDPPLLVGDEPTGNLDTKTADQVFALFGALSRRGKTLVMVTHDRELATRIPRVVRVQDGCVVSTPIVIASTFASLSVNSAKQSPNSNVETPALLPETAGLPGTARQGRCACGASVASSQPFCASLRAMTQGV